MNYKKRLIEVETMITVNLLHKLMMYNYIKEGKNDVCISLQLS